MNPQVLAARDELLRDYQSVRAWTRELCAPLCDEDYVVQSMPDASPAKWHIAHTSWFFETFLLKPHARTYRVLHPEYDFLFNSYYNAVGERHCRARRGVISRPTVAQAWEYRAHVDAAMEDLICHADEPRLQVLGPLISLGLNHEQQHQELMVTDLKHMLGENPLLPTYQKREAQRLQVLGARWIEFAEGIYWIGHDGPGFSFDNEGPRHRRFLEAFALCDRLCTNAEYLRFIEDGGYSRAELWLSAGWNTVQNEGWRAPMYWHEVNGSWQQFTLSGLREVEPSEPVCHLSFFEAEAFARWSKARLPTEFEWEAAAQSESFDALCQSGSFAQSRHFHPVAARESDSKSDTGLKQMAGEVWQWTRSQYDPYPGYAPAEGALGEYNGKFMCNQFVLRGASCATPHSHARRSYRNFFAPHSRWQFSGVRLARDV